MVNKVDELAAELCQAWKDNYTLSGEKAFIANELLRSKIIDEARQLGIDEKVYTRANDLLHGRQC